MVCSDQASPFTILRYTYCVGTHHVHGGDNFPQLVQAIGNVYSNGDKHHMEI